MLILTVMQIAACAYVMFVCVMVLNAMNHSTRNAVRYSYLALATGALAGIVNGPTISGVLFAWGVALYLACNERRGYAPERKSVS